MNKQLFIGIGVIFLLGVGYFFYSKSSGIPIYQKSAAGIIKGNIQDLFAKGTNMQCTFKFDDEKNNTEGNIYLSGKKMRGKFSSKQNEGTTIETNIIRDENYGYTWVEGQEQGTKLKIETSESISKNEVFALDNKKTNYDCKFWNVDNSKFTPPANVKFQDISAQVEKTKKTTDQLKDTKCDACNSAPSETAREQCFQALDCD